MSEQLSFEIIAKYKDQALAEFRVEVLKLAAIRDMKREKERRA